MKRNQVYRLIVALFFFLKVVGQFVQPNVPMRSPGATLDKDSISIGEALEASAVSAGDKPIDQSDAAAIQAAELRATGENKIIPGGIGAEAQSAATLNTRAMRNEDKTTLGDILTVRERVTNQTCFFLDNALTNY